MAVVTDNLAYDSTYQPFETPPQASTLFSLVPRGVRRFFFASDISAKPINDQLDVFLTATLPVNFAYLMRSFNLRFTGDTASDLGNRCEMRLSNHIPGQEVGTVEVVQCPLNLFTPATAAPSRVAVVGAGVVSMFAGPIWAVHGGSITFRAAFTNVAATAALAAFCTTHCEFYEYDLTQAQRYYINTPIPTISR